MGECFRQLRQWAKAAQAYRAFTKKHAGHELADDAHIRLIYLLGGRLKAPRQAIAECERLMQNCPGSEFAAEACYLRGMHYATQIKDNAKTIVCFRETIQIFPESTWAKKWAPKRIKQLQAEGGEK